MPQYFRRRQGSLSFRGEADGSMPEALKTSNRDIGVMITDMQGNVIRPQSGALADR
ncbi:hypothetical protein M8494_00340 [Serratia ureilytica]